MVSNLLVTMEDGSEAEHSCTTKLGCGYATCHPTARTMKLGFYPREMCLQMDYLIIQSHDSLKESIKTGKKPEIVLD